MKVLVQRVSKASVAVDQEVVASIGTGLLVFVGVERGDSSAEAERLARKVGELRVFEDEAGRMNRSMLECRYEALVVSQFTLCASTDKGRRPGFDRAMPPDEARKLVERFAEALRVLGVIVHEGRFGESMRVALVNDGPATFWLESR